MSSIPYKNIALYGIGGSNIGSYILDALLKDGSYNLTIIARESSKSSYPATLEVLRVSEDLEHTSLVAALHGQDVVVSAVGTAGIGSQMYVKILLLLG